MNWHAFFWTLAGLPAAVYAFLWFVVGMVFLTDRTGAWWLVPPILLLLLLLAFFMGVIVK